MKNFYKINKCRICKNKILHTVIDLKNSIFKGHS